jgi:4-hydroxybenzoate polyprenyltransferase
MTQTGITPSRRQAVLTDYLAIARFDHITKHMFIVPGLIIAYALREPPTDNVLVAIVVGFLSAVAIASANYVINEWLDREFDAYHPSKSARTAVNVRLSPGVVHLEYAAFALIGLALAFMVGPLFFAASALFLLSGLIYNVAPLRTKDRAYLDVVSESVNNPIRLVLGWAMLESSSLPPASLLLTYWAGGAFLMGAKRLSEFRDISAAAGIETLHQYRRSFRGYSLESLIVSCLLYAMICAFFLAVFLIRYRMEYVLAFPLIAALFACYLWLSMLKDSIAQRPERMFRSRRLVAALGLTVIAMTVLTFVDIPELSRILEPSFVPVDMMKKPGGN